MEKLLPISFRDWEGVAQAHSLNYPDHCRTGESCRRKFQALANKSPGTGTTRPAPTIRRAKEIREKIASINGSNSAEDEGIINEFFEEEMDDPSILLDLERANPPPEQTPTFIELTSTSIATERSEMARGFDISSHGSAARELNPPNVPAPLSRGQFEVSRRGVRSAGANSQDLMFTAWASMFMAGRNNNSQGGSSNNSRGGNASNPHTPN